ncbi:hypothetical protein HU200_039684 [Digitaria exilis]|uniref:RING-type E3 ubiquitin transferase n=1 Tax=Digitaria exilis TaxID=1010633 RepID=A0A835BA38_9POAL|nr:hypothetical protein HU200_039684 [Digitaria exilis]
MFFRTPPGGGETAAAEVSRSTRTWSSSSSSSTNGGRESSSSSLSGISNSSGGAYEQQEGSAGGGDGGNNEQVVGVAVGKEVKESKANLTWVLSNMDAIIDKTRRKQATVLLLHVHRPAKTIPFSTASLLYIYIYVYILGANFPAEQLHESEVSAFRQAETQAMHRAMAKYRAMCAKVKVQAVWQVLTVGGDGDVAQGILSLVAQHGVRRLVVGAAADKRYSSKMRAPSSRTAASVQQQAHPLCSVWFVCKGNLVCTRPAAEIVQLQVQGPALAPGGDDIFAEAEKRDDLQEVVQALEAQLLSSMRVIQDLQEKLSEAHCLLFSLERDQDELRRQRDAALREAAALRDRVRHLEENTMPVPAFVELSHGDLLEATHNLDDSLRLQGRSGGGYGNVYRAQLHLHNANGEGRRDVAVKVLSSSNPRPPEEFRRQAEELSKLRHPNVVPLLGACSGPDASALVYEYLPGGSLEARLPDLPWPERTRIAAEVRAALVFLHRNGVVHGDLKPANVLLLPDLSSSKLADSGLCRLLEPDAGVLLRCTLSASTVAYMDPEFLASGELRPTSDAYAFGVLLLQLLTGRPAMGLARQVQAAMAEGRLPEVLDAAPGEWPHTLDRAEQLARLALRCCELTSDNRPDLAGDMVDQALEFFQ